MITEVTEIKNHIEHLIKIQSSPGNYNCNEYMWGLANGLILALSVITKEDPKYIERPEKFLDDLKNPEFGQAVCQETPYEKV